MTTEKKELEDILFELASSDDLTNDAIQTAISDYPEHTDAIVQFFKVWSGGAVTKSERLSPDLPSPDLSHLWNPSAEIVDPFEGQSPKELRRIATVCEIPVSLLVNLEERLVQATSVPMVLIRKLAAELQTSAANMLEYLEQDQAIGASDFRSDSAPVVGKKISFASAVRSASMTDDQRQKWLSLSE